MPALLDPPAAAGVAAGGDSDVTVIVYSQESTEAGRRVGLRLQRLLMREAAKKAGAAGREIVAADDVEDSVADVARTLAAEFADAG